MGWAVGGAAAAACFVLPVVMRAAALQSMPVVPLPSRGVVGVAPVTRTYDA